MCVCVYTCVRCMCMSVCDVCAFVYNRQAIYVCIGKLLVWDEFKDRLMMKGGHGQTLLYVYVCECINVCVCVCVCV